MTHWWEIGQGQGPAKVRAVAYYRHSAQDRQENSIPIQRNQVREWAEQHGAWQFLGDNRILLDIRLLTVVPPHCLKISA